MKTLTCKCLVKLSLIDNLVQASLKISELPKVLLIQLKRFTWNGSEVKKSKAFVDCPFLLEPFEGSSSYQLVATISHLNSVSSGHYIATVRNGSEWFLCNDRSVKKVLRQNVLSQNTYLLFYERSDGGISGPG